MKALSILCGAVALSMLAWASAIYLIVSLYILYSFFGSAVWSPINTIVAALTPVTERGLSYSVYFFTEGLLVSVAPVLVAGVMELTGVRFVLPFCLIFLVTSLIILQSLRPRL